MKIVFVTQHSIIYKISEGKLAKQALIKNEYSNDEKLRLMLNNVY